MKLLFCQKCEDIFRIYKEGRYCKCGAIWGRYLDDGWHAEYLGEDAVPLFFGNHSFKDAIIERPDSGMGSTFIAGIIPFKCDTMRYKK